MKEFCNGYNYRLWVQKGLYGPVGAFQVTPVTWTYVTVVELLAKHYVKNGGRLWD